MRDDVVQHVLRVDNSTATDVTRDSDVIDSRHSVHFDVGDELYIGGVPHNVLATLARQIRSRNGFQGCLASVGLDGDDRGLIEQGAEIPVQFSTEISDGCEG